MPADDDDPNGGSNNFKFAPQTRRLRRKPALFDHRLWCRLHARYFHVLRPGISQDSARAPIAVSVTPCLEVPNSRVAELHESGKAPSLAGMRPLKADWTRFFPRRLRRVVGDVANLRPVQGDLETRALEGDLDMVPIFLLAEIRELLVARVEPEDVSSDGFRMHTVDDDANELSRLATPEVHLIAGPQIHAAVVGACGTRAVRGCRLLGKHEVDLQLEVFESRQRNETPTFLTRSCPSANDDAVLHFPAGLGGAQGRTVAARWDGPAGEVLAIEERLPRLGRLQRRQEHETKQRDDAKRNAFHRNPLTLEFPRRKARYTDRNLLFDAARFIWIIKRLGF